MDLVKYSVTKSIGTEDIKILLKRMGLEKSLWYNDGLNFFHQSKEQLRFVLDVIRKTYKRLCIDVHPRKLGDDETSAANLNCMMQSIEERFDWHLNKKRLVYEKKIKDDYGLIECGCGCRELFENEKLGNGQYRKYFSLVCRKKAAWKRKYEIIKRSKPFISRDDFPLVYCKCGCGTRFRQPPRKQNPDKKNNLKVYFNSRCARIHYFKIKKENGLIIPIDKEKRKEKWRRYYEKRYGFTRQTAPFIPCECGCGRELRKVPCGKSKTGYKRWFSNQCKQKIQRKKQSERHKRLMEILNGSEN